MIQKQTVRKVVSFKEAQKIVHSLGIESPRHYKELAKQGKLPKCLPRSPEYYYGWGANGNRQGRFPSYEHAKKIVHKHKIKSKSEWDKFRKTKQFPIGIPKDPPSVYRDEWKGWADWLGTNNVKNIKGYSITGVKYWNYKKARTYVRKFNFFSSKEFKKAKKKGKIPDQIPSDAADVYKSLGTWETWPKFLGHNNIGGAMANYNFMKFKDARKWARKSGIKSLREFKKAHSKGLVPKNIPCHSDDYYNKTEDWRGWNDFLASYKNIHQSKFHKWRSYEAAKRWVSSKKFKTIKEYKEFCKSGKKPLDIPVDPQRVYGGKYK